MDIEHYYVERGAGDPLILLHGNGEDSGYFARQIADFSKEYRVIALDSRGHGKTPRGSAPMTIRQFANDLADFLMEKGIERTHILGFSDGANVAMCFAAKYPERVMRLVLNGGNLDTRGVKAWVQLPVELGYRLARLGARRSEEARRHAEILGLMVGQPNITLEELGRITAPTLVIAGTKDMIKDAHTRFIAGHIAGAKLSILEGDHFLAAKRAKAFDRVVGKFLRGE